MKTLLLVVAVSTALLGASQAAFQATPDVPTDGINLICRPPLDRNDRNPVIRTTVNVTFQNGYEVKEFEVLHELYNGQIIVRSKQYIGTVGHSPGMNEWFWRGRLARNPQIEMMARVSCNGQNEWRYEEDIFKYGHLDSSTVFGCTSREGE